MKEGKNMIRLATLDDLESIIKIEQICFPKAESASAKELQERFTVFHDNFIVAVIDDQVVGFINGATTSQPLLPDELYHDVRLHDPQGDYQTVFGLDVLPKYRNQGIAEQLMNQMIHLSQKRGKKGIVLTCKDHLIHYYEKFGFIHQGQSSSNHGGATWNDMLLLFDK